MFNDQNHFNYQLSCRLILLCCNFCSAVFYDFDRLGLDDAASFASATFTRYKLTWDGQVSGCLFLFTGVVLIVSIIFYIFLQ